MQKIDLNLSKLTPVIAKIENLLLESSLPYSKLGQPILDFAWSVRVAISMDIVGRLK